METKDQYLTSGYDWLQQTYQDICIFAKHADLPYKEVEERLFPIRNDLMELINSAAQNLQDTGELE